VERFHAADRPGSRPLIAQLVDHELAHRVVEIGRVERATPLLFCIGHVLNACSLNSFSDSPPSSRWMKPDRGNEPDVAEQASSS